MNKKFEKIKEYWNRSKPIAERYRLPNAFMFADRVWCRFVHGAHSDADYDYFGMYRLNALERHNFFTSGRFKKACSWFFNDEMLKKVDSKKGFAESFKDFTKREILLLPCSEEAMRSFAENKTDIIVKAEFSCAGAGVRKLSTKEIINNKILLSEIVSMNGVAEEVIIQHPDMEALNHDSVSSLRITSLVEKNGSVNIMSAALRIGKAGECVDNTHSGGVLYEVDKETGIVVGYGRNKSIDKVIKSNTGLVVPGFQIPFWPEVLAVIESAANRFPAARFVGWDVAIGPDGPVLIEANICTGPDVFQFGDFGCWNYLRRQR